MSVFAYMVSYVNLIVRKAVKRYNAWKWMRSGLKQLDKWKREGQIPE